MSWKWSPHDGISASKQRPQRVPSPSSWYLRAQWEVYYTEKITEPYSYCHSDLKPPASCTVRNKFLLFKSNSVCCTFYITAWTKAGVIHGLSVATSDAIKTLCVSISQLCSQLHCIISYTPMLVRRPSSNSSSKSREKSTYFLSRVVAKLSMSYLFRSDEIFHFPSLSHFQPLPEVSANYIQTHGLRMEKRGDHGTITRKRRSGHCGWSRE